jgi:DNA-binding XRE family transcriptional regulator
LIGLQEKMMSDSVALTPGEALWLWRRREIFTRRGAADWLGIPRATILALERGTGGTDAALPRYVTGLRPTPPEALRIARRRSSLGSREVATRLGVSRMTVWKWERAADERLVAFWDGYVLEGVV